MLTQVHLMKTALSLLALSVLGFAGFAPTPAPQKSEKVSFEKKIQPILNKNCTKCHNADRAQKGLNLASYDGLMKGTRDAKVIKAGKSAESILYKSIKGLPGGSKMPPGKGKSLADADIKAIAEWIDQGAEKN